MMLALDIGNTRVKWGLRERGRWRARGAADTRPLGTLADRLAGLPGAALVAYSNVAGRGAEQAVVALARRAGARRVRIEPRRESCGVRNGYRDVSQLGSDRWAALVAAWGLARASAVVVNAGTAATMDMLDDRGRFIGGVICPGVGLMLESLQRRSAALRTGAGRVLAHPRSTADAMRTGAVLALTAAIEKLAEQLEARCGTPPVIVLSGGDSALLAGLRSRRVRRVEGLVLEGVALIAEEEVAR